MLENYVNHLFSKYFLIRNLLKIFSVLTFLINELNRNSRKLSNFFRRTLESLLPKLSNKIWFYK